jgi:hypothetical protein
LFHTFRPNSGGCWEVSSIRHWRDAPTGAKAVHAAEAHLIEQCRKIVPVHGIDSKNSQPAALRSDHTLVLELAGVSELKSFVSNSRKGWRLREVNKRFNQAASLETERSSSVWL